MTLRCLYDLALAAGLFGQAASAQDAAVRAAIAAQLDPRYPAILALYQHLHAHPELSWCETNTSARLAEELKQVGCEVTLNVGGHGVVAVLRHGRSPTVLVRAEIDALSVKEQTGLPYASTVIAKDLSGNAVSVMHACGHDVHVACLVGTAQVLARHAGVDRPARRGGWRRREADAGGRFVRAVFAA